uniref:AIG1-type G domain-containing protein n=1 Tax=Hippocampus comes TaxID=109280 RepID=A0A3Q2XPL0_HIPCM
MENDSEIAGLEDLRLVLLGNTGSGKSATGNTSSCQNSVTEPAEGHDQQILRRLTVVDMPGFGDTCLSEEQIYTEMVKCLSFCAPGPHAFLLVVPIGPYTEDADQSILNLAKIFGDDAVKYHTVVLFTKWDQLQGMEDSPAALRNLIDKCGGRYQVFNNLQNSNNPAQVQELLSKVDSMVKQSKSGFYSNAMFEEAEAIREEQRRIMLENKRRGSSGASEQMREEAVRSSRVLERLTRVVVTGVIGLTVGIAFGVSLTPTVAAAVSGKTAMALGAAIGGAIRVVAVMVCSYQRVHVILPARKPWFHCTVSARFGQSAKLLFYTTTLKMLFLVHRFNDGEKGKTVT